MEVRLRYSCLFLGGKEQYPGLLSRLVRAFDQLLVEHLDIVGNHEPLASAYRRLVLQFDVEIEGKRWRRIMATQVSNRPIDLQRYQGCLDLACFSTRYAPWCIRQRNC